MDGAMPATGTEGRQTFTVGTEHTTTAFGTQDTPPGEPAATDAAPGEQVDVLGTAHLLARVEFVGRESVRGDVPPGMGVVGNWSEVDHRSAAPVGAEITVSTRLDRVDGRDLVFDGTLTRTDTADQPVVGTATVCLRVVDRDRFHDAIDE